MRLTLIILILSISSLIQAGEILIDTVAQVKNHVITSREVQIHYLLDKSLGSQKDYSESNNPVEQNIREWLLFYEARAFYNNKLPAYEKQKAVNKAINKLSKMKDWKQLGVTQKELSEMIERRLEARRLYTFKKKAAVLPVSPADVEAEYTQNRIRYGTLKFEEVKDKIRHKKIQENLEGRLAQWFQVLERKYRVQRFAKFNQ